MDCHIAGGTAIRFRIAGSVYDYTDTTQTFPDATIEIYSGENGSGELLTSIEVDAFGNFYTSASYDWMEQVYYPAIVVDDIGANRTSYMPRLDDPLSYGGRCNNCHTGTLTSFTTHKINSGVISPSNGSSHNAGQNCMDALCHSAGGNAPIVFTAAGTLYTAANKNNPGSPYLNSDAWVYLYTQPSLDINSQRITTIPVDASGNFYTAQPITEQLNTGVYPFLESVNTSTIVQMAGITQSGQCNVACHGSSTDYIYID